MYRLPASLIALMLLGLAAPARAQNAPCAPFNAFPLSINLGVAPLGIGGETPRCANQKTMDAINTLAATVGLGTGGAGAQPLTIPSLTLTGPGSSGQVGGMSATPSTSAPAGTLNNLLANRMLSGGNDLSAYPFTGLGAYIPFGNTDAKHYLYSHRDDTQPSLLGTAATVRNTPGSGTFGPSAADFAHFFSITKDGWSTSTGSAAREGELDTIYSIARQGKKGDVSVLLGDVAKRRDVLNQQASDENGGVLGYEIGAALTNSTGAAYHEVHSYAPFIEGIGGISQGAGYGFLTTSFKGRQYAAYGATLLPGAPAGAGFARYGFLDTTGAADGSGIIWQVDATGRAYSGLPNSRVTYGYQPGIDTFTVTDESNAVIQAVGRTSKVTTAVGGIQIGTGSIVNFRNSKSATVTIPSLASLGVADVTTLAITGAQPGDLVTCAITSADVGLAGFRMTGVVSAAGSVTVRAQNLNSTTAGGVAAVITAKVERFQ